jgi:hypothetical protein
VPSFEDLDNEEEIRVCFLFPLLLKLGLSRDDLHLERSFSFKCGRQELEEDVRVQIREKRPRYDLLITRGGHNLFIVEAKHPTLQLTEEDALQAISYARLVHPMAPYALVTNGSDTQLYSTVSRKRIEPTQVLIDGSFEVVLPNSDDFEALDCFLRINFSNLLRFSRAQVNRAQRALRGSSSNPSRKFNPELHIPRAVVGQALQDFRRSSQSTLGLIGESGIGKTYTMCYRATELLDSNQAVLFFRGSEIGTDLLAEIAAEFSWTFSESLLPPALMKRLSSVLIDRTMVIFVDGVDEWPRADAYQQLGSLASHLAGTRIKLVVSCKSTVWPTFIERRGVPTDFSDTVMCYNDRPGFLLTAFNDEEFYSALEKYGRIYGFHGVWDKSLLEEAKRSPFFMRIAFEVASELGLSHLRETKREIFERYYKSCLGTTLKRELSERMLVAVARACVEGNSDRIELEQLRAALGLRLLEELPVEPFLSGALEQTSSGDADSSDVRYVFDGLRNYVIAFKVCCWHQMTVARLQSDFDETTEGTVKEEAFVAYYKVAPEEHKRAFDHRSYGHATQFFRAYKTIIQEHFAAFASSFPRGNLDRTGLVLEANLRTGAGYAYGLRLLYPGDPEILILPTVSGGWLSDNLLRWGAGGLSNRLTAKDWLHDVDPFHELLRVNFSRLVRGIVQMGALNEQATPELAKELLAAAVLSKPEIINEPNRGPGTEHLPLTAGRIKYWLLLHQHWHRLEDELIQEKLRTGAIQARREGGFLSYEYPPLTEEERLSLRASCDELIAREAEVEGPRVVPFSDLADSLMRAIAALPSENVIIDGPLFPQANRYWRARYWTSSAEAELLDSHCTFMKLFLTNYERLVASNFPTLKQHFALFRELPVLLQVAIRLHPGVEPVAFVDFLVPEGFTLQDNVIETVQLAERAPFREPAVIGGRTYRWLLGHNSSVAHMGSSWGRHPNLGIQSQFTVVRNFTYSWIEKELEDVWKELGEGYGLTGLKF